MEQRQGSKPEYPITRKLWLEERPRDEWLSVMKTTPPAPEAIIEMVKCGCVKQRCSTNRWSLFKKKQVQSEILPPTQGALREAILRAQYQTMVWNNDKVPNPNIPSPENYGWKKDRVTSGCL